MGGSGSSTDFNAAQGQYANANGALNTMNPVISGLTQGGYSMPQINQSAFSYLLNPQGTSFSQIAPSLQGFYGNEMTNGLSQQTIGAANNQYQTNQQQTWNSMMNQMGPNANMGSIANQFGLNSMMGSAALNSQLGGLNQQVQQQGAAGLGQTALGLDQQTMQMFLSALQAGTGEQGMGLSALQNIYGTSTGAGSSLTGQGAQLSDQENNWAGDISSLVGGAASIGAMGSMGVNPFTGFAKLFGH